MMAVCGLLFQNRPWDCRSPFQMPKDAQFRERYLCLANAFPVLIATMGASLFGCHAQQNPSCIAGALGPGYWNSSSKNCAMAENARCATTGWYSAVPGMAA